MKIFTHNLLQCHVKNCLTDNYPLQIKDAEVVEIETDFNPDFISKMISRLDWKAFVDTAASLGIAQLPQELPLEFSEEFLKTVHHVAFEFKVEQGQMVCNGCGHVYPISNGIPNMLLFNTEV